MYVGDELVSKYWEYTDGIYFTVFDPQFFIRHEGKQLRFSQNGTDFHYTGMKLAAPPVAAVSTAKGKAARPKGKAARTKGKAARLPLQADVLK